MNGFRKLSLLILLCAVAAIALPALAQVADAVPSELPFELPASWAAYVLIALAVVELAKRVAVIVPGKRDDEITGVVERVLRTLVDFLAGKPKDPADQSLRKG